MYQFEAYFGCISFQEYNLTVRVFDGKHEDTTYVIIKLKDVNDNAPKFDPDIITINNITEGQEVPSGTPPAGGLFLTTVRPLQFFSLNSEWICQKSIVGVRNKNKNKSWPSDTFSEVCCHQP
jgi:hypothetical protein